MERTGTPVSAVRTENGDRLLTLYTLDLEHIGTAVERLRAGLESVEVRHIDGARDPEADDTVLVDRGTLTGGQGEVAQTKDLRSVAEK